MPTVTVATFNCENLFARFKFEEGVDPEQATKNGFTVNELNFSLSAARAVAAETYPGGGRRPGATRSHPSG